jgi:hypothetical protein
MLFEESVLLDYVHNKPFLDEYDAAVSERLKTTYSKTRFTKAKSPNILIASSGNRKT